MLTRVLILLFVVVLCAHSERPLTPHEKISKLLKQKNVDPNNPYVYAAEAKQYEDELIKKHWLKNSTIDMFAKLASLRNESCQCNSCAYLILSENDETAEQRTRNRPHLVGPLLESEQVLYKIGMEHAERCRGIYPARFKELIKTLDLGKLQHVQTIMSLLLQDGVKTRKLDTGDSLKSFIEDVHKNVTNWDKFQRRTMAPLSASSEGAHFYLAKELLVAIKRFAKDDRDRMFLDKVYDAELKKRVFDGNTQASKFLEKYFYGVCEYYADSIGKQVFQPLEYDLVVHAEPTMADYVRLESKEDTEDFYHSWANYKYCQAILAADKQPLRNIWPVVAYQLAE